MQVFCNDSACFDKLSNRKMRCARSRLYTLMQLSRLQAGNAAARQFSDKYFH